MTSDRALDRARAIAPLIAAEARESERLGRLTDAVDAAMKQANLFSMMRPRSAGGLGCSRVEFFETVEEIARADGAAGWSLSVCASVIQFIHEGASAEVNEEIFGHGPVGVWTSILPRAVSRAVEGGYRMSGSFSMGSGSSLSDWVLVAAPLPDRNGQQWFRAHILPRRDVVIDPASWDVMGLRATASIEYAAHDVFVPEHRAFEYPYLKGGRPGGVSTLWLGFTNQIGLTAFASGVARRAMDELIAAAPKIRRLLGDGYQADDNVVQFGVGDLEGRLAAVRSYYLAQVADQDRQVAETGGIDAGRTLTLSQAAQVLTRTAREATLFAFDHAGTKVVYADDPIQRCVRDILTGLKHASFSPNVLTRIGRTKMGVESAPARLP